jgi:hypothetical protein
MKALIVFVFVLAVSLPLSAATFNYDQITDPIVSAQFSVDFAALVANRTVFGEELNYAQLINAGSGGDTYDLSDDLFGTAVYPNPPKINMGRLQTHVFSVDIAPSFFPALAGGNIALAFCFTDTDDSMFAIDFMSLTINTNSETVQSFYGWPVGNPNNGFGIGLADGADLPAPLPISIPVGATGTGFDETIGSKVPEPATLILFAGGAAALFLKRTPRHHDNRNKTKHPVAKLLFVPILITYLVLCGQTAFAVHISDVNICQMDFYGTNAPRIEDTNWGDFRFTLVPDEDPNNYYLNLCIRQNQNGPVSWVIDNMMIPSSSDINAPFTGARFFSLADFVQPGTPIASLEYKIQFSTEPFESAPSGGTFTPASVHNGLYDTGSGSNEGSGLLVKPDPGPPPVPRPPPVSGYIRKVVRWDVPDVEEERNECAPGSVARSLLWLHKRKLINLGAKADPNTLKQEFKAASKWDAVNGVPSYKDWLTGKLKITKGLKVVNKFVVRKPSSVPDGDFETPDGKAVRRGYDPTFEFIRNEIDSKEDIEICVGWLDPNNVRDSGHTMTVIGYAEDSGKEIWVQDDPHQGRKDDKNDRRNTRYTNGNPPKLDHLPKNRVEMIVSESPEPKYDQVHVYPIISPYSPYLPAGATGVIKASVQLDFAPVYDADVEFAKAGGDFTFNNGIILEDGSKTAITADANGIAQASITANSAGPALVRVSVTGSNPVAAYLFLNIISCPLIADLDGNCAVNFTDLAMFASYWLETGCGTCGGADFTGDSTVDLADLAILVQEWLHGK